MLSKAFKRLKYWLRMLFADDTPKPPDKPRRPLLGDEFFAPRREYLAHEINPDVIINNHMVHEAARNDMIGHAINSIWEELGEMKGAQGLIKRIVVGFVMLALGAYVTSTLLPAVLGG